MKSILEKKENQKRNHYRIKMFHVKHFTEKRTRMFHVKHKKTYSQMLGEVL